MYAVKIAVEVGKHPNKSFEKTPKQEWEAYQNLLIANDGKRVDKLIRFIEFFEDAPSLSSSEAPNQYLVMEHCDGGDLLAILALTSTEEFIPITRPKEGQFKLSFVSDWFE